MKYFKKFASSTDADNFFLNLPAAFQNQIYIYIDGHTPDNYIVDGDSISYHGQKVFFEGTYISMHQGDVL